MGRVKGNRLGTRPIAFHPNAPHYALPLTKIPIAHAMGRPTSGGAQAMPLAPVLDGIDSNWYLQL
jgi:hypothetical protein